jgi:hypothetical protein
MRIKKIFKRQKVNSKQIDAIYSHKKTTKRRAVKYQKKLSTSDTLNIDADSNRVRKIKKQTMHMTKLNKYSIRDSLRHLFNEELSNEKNKQRGKAVKLQVRISQCLRKFDPFEWVQFDLPHEFGYFSKVLIVEGNHLNSFQHRISNYYRFVFVF